MYENNGNKLQNKLQNGYKSQKKPLKSLTNMYRVDIITITFQGRTNINIYRSFLI
jgi:hypothetical protein